MSRRAASRRRSVQWWARTAAVAAAGLLSIGCSGPGAVAGTPTASSLPPTATQGPGPSGGPGPVIVTFRVGGTEEFRVLLVEPDDISTAYALLSGRPAPAIPNGRLVRGENSVNPGHDWTLDPSDFEFADLTTEVCDALPSIVDDLSFTSDRFCPWTATVVAVEPVGTSRSSGQP